MGRDRAIRRSFLLTALLLLSAASVQARNPYRTAFFSAYPSANGTAIATVPSRPSHCGVCHFDFAGSGPRNPYGIAVGVAIASGNYGSTSAAILSLDGLDTDGDGYTNHVEILDTANFSNTPTFPGLTATNVSSVINVSLGDIQNHLTPSGGSDTTPPQVFVLGPNGGETVLANGLQAVTWSADDPSGIGAVNVYYSDDGGLHWHTLARGLDDTGSFTWFVSNRPGTVNLIRVEARDGAGNLAHDDSNGYFTIPPVAGGVVPTTLRDFDLPGTQPLEAGILDDPTQSCVTCHGEYNHAVEPWHGWRGSMMAQAMRDPLYLATLAVAQQDAPAVGDLCLRCHTPGGWQEGRSADTSGGLVTAKDRESVQCDFCHRLVDPHYSAGTSPIEDLDILGALAELPWETANGQFVTDPNPVRRGPFADAQADHQFLESPFHREAGICGTCHDVSNPVFVRGASPGEYVADDLDAPHPDGDLRNMFPVERTFSEWSVSEYATTGVYAPQFAGNKPDGIVGKCQDCHMKDVTGRGAAGGPVRNDLPLHDLTGGNHFVGDILADFFPGEVSAAQLQDAKLRAEYMLSLAATLELTESVIEGQPAVTVKVTNETGHKLPSGYPEGRRIWINLKAYDATDVLVYESGAYDTATGELSHDADAKIYQIKPGVSTRLAGALSLEAGPSFHFVLNDSIYSDNRIPPRGFTNAAFTAIQSPPVGHAYADGQYWDETVYLLPQGASWVEATLYYQTTSKEYIEFLRDANETNTLGDELYAAWVNQGRAAPVTMASAAMLLSQTGLPGDTPAAVFALQQNAPNPFNPSTRIEYSLAAAGSVRLSVLDAQGRLVAELVNDIQSAGVHAAEWQGRDAAGRPVASGVYLYRLEAEGRTATRKMLLLK